MRLRVLKRELIGNLSKDVFERRTSTGSEAFSLLICLDANKFVLLSFFSLIKTIYQRVSTEPLPNDAKSSLPVEVRRSKMLLLKLPNITVKYNLRLQVPDWIHDIMRKLNLSSCVYVLKKTWLSEILRRSAVKAKKCTKKCAARAGCCFAY